MTMYTCNGCGLIFDEIHIFELPKCDINVCQECYDEHIRGCWECYAGEQEEEAAYVHDRSVRF